MRRLALKNLLLSSFILLAISSCAPVRGYKLSGSRIITDKEVRPLVDKNSSLLYRATIDIYTKHYSGLILLKQTGPGIAHLLFVTEIGMKMFDFEIRDTSFNLVQVFEPLNKPKITNLLTNDMKLLLQYQLFNREAKVYEKKKERIYKTKKDKLRYFYYTKDLNAPIDKIKVKGKIFTKAKVNYVYNDSINPRQILLKHKGLIRLSIELNHLNKSKE